jgi:hypothetical protein
MLANLGADARAVSLNCPAAACVELEVRGARPGAASGDGTHRARASTASRGAYLRWKLVNWQSHNGNDMAPAIMFVRSPLCQDTDHHVEHC